MGDLLKLRSLGNEGLFWFHLGVLLVGCVVGWPIFCDGWILVGFAAGWMLVQGVLSLFRFGLPQFEVPTSLKEALLLGVLRFERLIWAVGGTQILRRPRT